MSNQKADTSLDQLINIVQQISGNQITNNLHKTIQTISKKRKIYLSPDSNLNKTFFIKRINYTVIATIISANDTLYTAKILSVEGKSFNKVGDELTISKRELQLTAHPTSLTL